MFTISPLETKTIHAYPPTTLKRRPVGAASKRMSVGKTSGTPPTLVLTTSKPQDAAKNRAIGECVKAARGEFIQVHS